MININKLYEKEKIINTYFKNKYDYSDKNIFNKQVLELIVELNELAYETKCFKYWKKVDASPADITIAEYADCLMITLSFCDLADLNIIDIPVINEQDIVTLFIKLNNLASNITMDLDNNILLNLLGSLLQLGTLLNYTSDEMNKYIDNKFENTLKMIKG